MLRKLRLKNYKSFKEFTEIDLEPTKYQGLLDTNISNNILKGCCFYGANASGKTNALSAIKSLIEMLFGNQINLNLVKCIFSKEKDILLEYEFLIDDKIIIYSITYRFNSGVVKEILYLNGTLLLDRTGSSAESFISNPSQFISDIDSDSLILREIYFNTKFRENETLKKWFNFLINSIYIDVHNGELICNSKNKLFLDEYLEEYGEDKINRFFEDVNFDQTIEYVNECKGDMSMFKTDNKNIFFKRKGVNEPIPFPFESLGNQNLLQLLPAFFHTLENNGMLLIDEFSSGFHNQLEQLLVKYFMDNSKNSQLFFVSHSTNLLTNSLMRPDQIYAVNFNGNEGSIIKKFSDEKPRIAQNIEKMYLSGVFDGLPNYNR
ncbi:MAG: AAA family ATPase [Romboutsia sp.]|uniref:AAA family ATPase n=1 Tax=Romboutsia sp. TaxID=1965302 RepID=UPI003F3C181A